VTAGPQIGPPSPSVAQAVSGAGHQVIQAAEQEIQIGLVPWPELAVQRGIDLIAGAAHLEEQSQRLAGHVLGGQPDDLRAQVLQGGFARVAAFGGLGVVVAFVRGQRRFGTISRPIRQTDPTA
jgi:hypothetical protein